MRIKRNRRIKNVERKGNGGTEKIERKRNGRAEKKERVDELKDIRVEIEEA